MNKNAEYILKTLNSYGFKAYIVGGAVRDFLMEKEIHDWDIATNAKPAEVKKIFKCYDSGIRFGTVSAIVHEEHFEITTFRTESDYTDGRRPEVVNFADTIEEDLSRRDFTINAIAMDVNKNLVDPFNGQEDIKNKVLRAVGYPAERFKEDALRIIRGWRFIGKYSLSIEAITSAAMIDLSSLVNNVSKERLAEELEKILMSFNYIDESEEFGNFREAIKLIIPEIEVMFSYEQHNPHHDHDVWRHTYRTLVHSPDDFVVRLSLLLHDIGKPASYKIVEGIGRFRKHGVISSDITEKVMERLKFSSKFSKLIISLVLEHDADIPNKTALKRLLTRIGKENFDYWAHIRESDIKGQKYRPDEGKLERLSIIRKWFLEIVTEEEALSVKDLKINGFDMQSLGLAGEDIGKALKICLEAIINNNSLNNIESLTKIVINIKDLK